ncbi:hypothetical protein AOLI_G00129390 [Acnodon oligacanthus]
MTESADAEGHSAQRSPTFCRVHHYRPPNFMWPSDQLKNSVESFMEWVSMAEQLRPSLTSPSAVQSVECSGVKRRHWTLEQWRRVLWSDQSRFSVWHLWDEPEWRLRARSSRPTSVSDLTNALLEERSKIPMNTLLTLVESLPRRAEAVIAAKG